MRFVGLLAVGAWAACGGKAAPQPVTPTASDTACREAYVEYESRWRLARTEELEEVAAGDRDILEEILYYELATLPSRVEVEKLREIYAVVDAFLWNAPMPRALAAADTAIGHCGERAARPGA
jgi:hypothetical protein